MKYTQVIPAIFINRENRFIASVKLSQKDKPDKIVKVHVKNTGRCKELLVPGATVWLEDFEGRMGSRKMRYSLIAVEKEPAGAGGGRLLINMDSQAPNKVVQEALSQGLMLPGMAAPASLIKPEYTYGKSRFDFYIEYPINTGNSSASASTAEKTAKAFIEVKGVTLEDKGFARFPDAPTERGIKHVRELARAASEGYQTYIIFVIQMNDITGFGPNYDTHPAFGEALLSAKASGVNILAFDCLVKPDHLSLRNQFSQQQIKLDR